jgi:hypothetical protein
MCLFASAGPAIKAALEASQPTDSQTAPDVTINRFDLDQQIDPSGDQSIFGQVSKAMLNRGHRMLGRIEYGGGECLIRCPRVCVTLGCWQINRIGGGAVSQGKTDLITEVCSETAWSI